MVPHGARRGFGNDWHRKALDERIYRSEPIPVNPVIRNSNHEQSHTIHGARNSASLHSKLVGRLRMEFWHSANHELIEERHREGHIAMGWAVDHSLLDELGTQRAEAGNFDFQGIGDVSCAMRSRS